MLFGTTCANWDSPRAHHISITTWRGFESSYSPDLHPGAPIYVGTDNEVGAEFQG